ncbi:MAG: hypothetical protein ACXVDF_19465 [Ktedonobacterales bacterium]
MRRPDGARRRACFQRRRARRLVKGSSRPKRTWQVFGPAQAERLRALLHCSPRDFGQPTSVWTLALAAEVTAAQGIVADRVSGETIR